MATSSPRLISAKPTPLPASHEADLVVLTKEIRTPFSFGKVVSKEDCLIGLEEKPNFRFEILSGIYVLKPALFSLIPKNTYYGIDTLIKDMLAANMKVGKYLMPEYWLDIGQIEDFQEAQEVYKTHFGHLKTAPARADCITPEFIMDYRHSPFCAELRSRGRGGRSGDAALQMDLHGAADRRTREDFLPRMTGSPHAVAVTNCTAALHLAHGDSGRRIQ